MNQAVSTALSTLDTDTDQIVTDMQAHVDNSNQDAVATAAAIMAIDNKIVAAHKAFLASTAGPTSDPTPTPTPTPDPVPTPVPTPDATLAPAANSDPASGTATDVPSDPSSVPVTPAA